MGRGKVRLCVSKRGKSQERQTRTRAPQKGGSGRKAIKVCAERERDKVRKHNPKGSVSEKRVWQRLCVLMPTEKHLTSGQPGL